MTEQTKLWLLRPIVKYGKFDPWEPWYDKCFGFVIRASSELEARGIANQNAGDENREIDSPWLNPKYSSCTELEQKGPVELVIKDFRSA